MGQSIKNSDQLYFNKDHDMVRRAVRDFINKEINPHVDEWEEAGLDATREISMSKLIAGELLNKVADGCLQMHGGMGYMKESIISRYYRDARGLSIGGGADEVMLGVIAKMENFS
jgi:citronellyl-CoA dehydrogenase